MTNVNQKKRSLTEWVRIIVCLFLSVFALGTIGESILFNTGWEMITGIVWGLIAILIEMVIWVEWVTPIKRKRRKKRNKLRTV